MGHDHRGIHVKLVEQVAVALTQKVEEGALAAKKKTREKGYETGSHSLSESNRSLAAEADYICHWLKANGRKMMRTVRIIAVGGGSIGVCIWSRR